MTNQIYAIRYRVEEWNKPRGKGTRVRPGIRVSEEDNGYCDAILVASIMVNDDGEAGSVLLLGHDGKEAGLNRKLLETVKAQIEHYLEHHCEEPVG